MTSLLDSIERDHEVWTAVLGVENVVLIRTSSG